MKNIQMQIIKDMNIKTVDFESLLKDFIPYHESLKSIQSDKIKYEGKLNDISGKMQSIINSAQTLVLDKTTQMESEKKLRALQTEGRQLEMEFKNEISKRQSEELESNFNKLVSLVEEWSGKNKIDLVINKNSVVFGFPKFDITSDILSLMKDQSFYRPFSDFEKEIEENVDVVKSQIIQPQQ